MYTVPQWQHTQGQQRNLQSPISDKKRSHCHRSQTRPRWLTKPSTAEQVDTSESNKWFGWENSWQEVSCNTIRQLAQLVKFQPMHNLLDNVSTSSSVLTSIEMGFMKEPSAFAITGKAELTAKTGRNSHMHISQKACTHLLPLLRSASKTEPPSMLAFRNVTRKNSFLFLITISGNQLLLLLT